MASSNKVVVIKRGAFGVCHDALEIFDSRKAVTSWLQNPENIDLVFPGNGDFLREAVDESYNEGTPLRYNSNIVIGKWLSGTIQDDAGILVRVVLKRVDLSGVGLEIFAQTESLTKDSLSQVFKVLPEATERARVVTSLEPFSAASKVGLQIGDILLRQRSHRQTDLLLVSETQPQIVELEQASNDDHGSMFVARIIPTSRGGGTGGASLAGIRSVSSFDSDEASDDSPSTSTLEKEKVATPRAPSSGLGGLRSRVKQSNGFISPARPRSAMNRFGWSSSKAPAGIRSGIKPANEFLSPRPGSVMDRFGWSSHSKAPPNHIFATEAKRAQFQSPPRDPKTGLPVKTLSVHKTRALMGKRRYCTSSRDPNAGKTLGDIPVDLLVSPMGTLGLQADLSEASKTGLPIKTVSVEKTRALMGKCHSTSRTTRRSAGGIDGGDGSSTVNLAELCISDENADPTTTNTNMKAKGAALPSAQRITELEEEVASLKIALAGKGKMKMSRS